MSNTPRLGAEIPRGDMGIGLCYQCVRFLAGHIVAGTQDQAAGFVPNFAVVLAPYPEPALSAVLALPVCGDCLTGRGRAGTPAKASRRPLVVPR